MNIDFGGGMFSFDACEVTIIDFQLQDFANKRHSTAFSRLHDAQVIDCKFLTCWHENRIMRRH